MIQRKACKKSRRTERLGGQMVHSELLNMGRFGLRPKRDSGIDGGREANVLSEACGRDGRIEIC